jgi:hypothetical protein
MSKIRESARGEACTLRLPMICNFNLETTVLLHPNTHRAGKGKSLKAEDALGAYGCSSCHDALDGRGVRPKHLTKDEIELAFWHGHAETYLILKRKGLVK